MRKLLIVLTLMVLTCAPATAQNSISISIGFNVSQYPDLQRIPDYPVYYVPRLQANYFFYDGLYWLYLPQGWYTSPWYDGPWESVSYDNVPLPLLRIPLRYYGSPPVTFRTWRANEPPRWDAVWGQDWARRHEEWRRWDRRAAPAPAPLPSYQRQYTRSNYPDESRRRELVQQHYGYAPRDAQVRQQWQTMIGDTSRRPMERPSSPQQSQAPSARPHDDRTNDLRPSVRERSPTTGSEAPRAAPARPPEQPQVQAKPPHAVPNAGRPEAEDQGRDTKARAEHGGPPDKDNRAETKAANKAEKKAEKRGDHDSEKRE